MGLSHTQGFVLVDAIVGVALIGILVHGIAVCMDGVIRGHHQLKQHESEMVALGNQIEVSFDTLTDSKPLRLCEAMKGAVIYVCH